MALLIYISYPSLVLSDKTQNRKTSEAIGNRAIRGSLMVRALDPGSSGQGLSCVWPLC